MNNCRRVIQDNNITSGKTPIMLTTFVLQIPNIVVLPSLEELQHSFGKLIISILETHKHVIMWGQRHSSNKILDDSNSIQN